MPGLANALYDDGFPALCLQDPGTSARIFDDLNAWRETKRVIRRTVLIHALWHVSYLSLDRVLLLILFYEHHIRKGGFIVLRQVV